jgi:hypothetical protein
VLPGSAGALHTSPKASFRVAGRNRLATRGGAYCHTTSAGAPGHHLRLLEQCPRPDFDREKCQNARELVNSSVFPRKPAVVETLECLKKYGQRLDLELAKEMGMPIASVRQQLSSLAATGAIIMCSLTRFENGTRIDAWQCRVSGYLPPLAPGRKAKAST